MSPAEVMPEAQDLLPGPSLASRFSHLRGVRWRINLGVLPSSLSSTIDDLRRVTADSRRRYAGLRRHLLIDPHALKLGDDSSDLEVDNPLSQNPDSSWGRFFRNAELEKMVDKDLSRLYPEHWSYFQTPGCQALLRRILLLWCLGHPECGYRQASRGKMIDWVDILYVYLQALLEFLQQDAHEFNGMHELVAPLLYVLHADIQHLSEIRKLHEDHFVDKFDEVLFHETQDFNFKISSDDLEDYHCSLQERSKKHTSLGDLDADTQMTIMLNDPYGAEGELGIVLSEKFMEHDAYCMFDALMSGAGGTVAMAEFFSHSPENACHTGLAPVIEASLSLYHLLSIVDSSLYIHLVELGVEPQYFALRWLRVLFGREFSLEDLLVIWDEIFSFDNSKSVKSAEHNPGILNSPRGAFISAMAVSMMLSMRSSLLASEYAASCLQRLLNFPENVYRDKLIGKAKSLVALAMEANSSSHLTSAIGHGNCSKRVGEKGHGHSLSVDSSSSGTLVSLVPERYWEEKWRFIHQEDETKNENSTKQFLSKRKSWTDKVKLRLSRTESDPSSSKKENRERDHKSSARRSLLEDLTRELNPGEDTEETGNCKRSASEDPLLVGSDEVVRDDMQESVGHIDKASSGLSTASEEHSHFFSDPEGPADNDSEKSSLVSNISHDIIDGETQNSCSFLSTFEEDPLSISVAADANACGVSGREDFPREPLATASKERKTLSAKLQWIWKFGRHTSGEGTSDKRLEIEDSKSSDGGNQWNKIGLSAAQTNYNPVNIKTDGCDQNLICTLRNLGQSMLENIQVIEAAFQQEKSQVGSLDQISKHALVEKGQVTAMTALKELWKISNILREM